MIKYAVIQNRTSIERTVTIDKFPGGEVKVTLQDAPEAMEFAATVNILATLQNSDDVMALLLTVDAIRRAYTCGKLQLYIPYVPYARQDRVCNVGESLSIAVMAKLINMCNFDMVMISDPHSDVTPALINNVLIETQSEIFGNLREDWQDIYIVAPDAGAAKKASQFAKDVGAAGVVQCMKKRDVKTGKLGGFVCLDDVTGKKLFVLDDICDGGGTFVGLSEILRPQAARLELAVTHGIFSKGVDVVAECFDTVYTTNSFSGKILKGKNVICLDMLHV